LPKDFLGLADLRATTNADIQNLEKEIKELEEERIPRAESADRRKTDIQQQITETEAKKPQTPEDESKLAELRSQLNFLNNLPSADALSKRLDISKSTLAQKTQQASRIQSALASMLSPEEEFKRTMSITFAILIAIVIVGFFILAFKDAKIRQEIFSGEVGMQFLTLFSLVIAIILFGITQILEGKELAALLGGLSGYILGRTTPKEGRRSDDGSDVGKTGRDKNKQPEAATTK